jgi:hypothetical protein
VEVGYNPHKPGRGSHHPLLCVVAGTRLAQTAPQLDVQQTIERYLCWHNPFSPENWLG